MGEKVSEPIRPPDLENDDDLVRFLWDWSELMLRDIMREQSREALGGSDAAV